MNSSYIFNPESEEKFPITFSIDKNLDFYFSWVPQTYIDFFNTNDMIYKEESQNFWYDFEAQKGEWLINDTVVPIRMEFYGVTPIDVTLSIYDVSGEQKRRILYSQGELIDGNTFIAQELSGTMFYEGTVTEIRIIKTNPET